MWGEAWSRNWLLSLLKPIPIFEVKYQPILSDISYHCKVRIRISANLLKVKYRPIIPVGRYIDRNLSLEFNAGLAKLETSQVCHLFDIYSSNVHLWVSKAGAEGVRFLHKWYSAPPPPRNCSAAMLRKWANKWALLTRYTLRHTRFWAWIWFKAQ